MPTSQFVIPVKIESEGWSYETTPIRDTFDIEVTSDTTYEITIDGGTPESHTTGSTITHGELRLENRTTAPKLVTIGSDDGRTLTFPLAGLGTAVMISAMDPSASTGPMEFDMADEDDPKFSVKPVKPPSTTTSTQMADSSITWTGTAWSASTVVGNPNVDLEVYNTSGSPVELTIANSSSTSEQSTITITLPRTGLTLDFGSGRLFADGFLEVDSTQATLKILNAPM